MKNISIISPVYNEEKNLPFLINKFLELKKEIEKKDYQLKIIFVNDGSSDNSKEHIEDTIKNNDFISIINLTKNFGHQEAIYAGLKETTADYYGVIDSDLQQDPILFNNMLRNLEDHNCDIVQMRKKYSNYESSLKIFFSKFFYKIFNKLTKIDLRPGSSDFYLFSNQVKESIISTHISKSFIRGYIHWAGFKTIFIQYTPEKRNFGKSNYSFIKQLEFAMTGIYYYGQKISLYILVLSIIILLISFIYILYLIYDHYFMGTQTKGWASITILILIFGTINIFLTSILAFFVIKIFNTTGKKPTYLKKNKS